MTTPTTTAPPHPSSGQLDPEWVSPAAHSGRKWPLDGAKHERLGLAALLFGTAVLYLWGLGASGYANEFYAAAVQAGTQSWKAFFFGSFDSANAITVDKPPASLWPMELSGRIFGFNSWSMLVPQAIEGVLTVWLLYATVKRWFGHGAGLLAGALLALTPVAVLMFRFNNPDALMVLLIVLAAYCTTRALDTASTRWLLLAGGVMGFSFLAKGLQPFTVLPALAIAFLVCAPTSLRRRLLQLLGAGVAMIVGAGWWVLAVDLTPVADRPYIGGSGNNTALGLAFGYNGLDRLSSSGSGGPGGGGGFSGTAGIGRLFNSLYGGQIAWLLPTALVATLALVIGHGRRPRTDRTTAALIVWGGWLLVTGAVLSFASGIIHPYYSVQLAPAIAALVAIGTVTLWRQRHVAAARLGLATGVLVTGVWAMVVLGRSADFAPWLRWTLLVAAVVAAGLLVAPVESLRRPLVVLAAVLGLGVLAGGPAAYALDTASTAYNGSTPSAGPAVSGAMAGPGGGFGGRGGSPGGSNSGERPSGFPGGTAGGAPGGTPGGSTGSSNSGSSAQGGPPSGGFPGGSSTGSANSSSGDGGSRGGLGGGATTTNSALTALLKKTTTTWAAATIGSQSAGPLELSTGKAVIAIGGFSGSDDAPTLAQFKAWVADGKIAYFVSGGGMGGGPGGQNGQSAGSAISSWVAAHYTAKTVGGTTVYDLSKATS